MLPLIKHSDNSQCLRFGSLTLSSKSHKIRSIKSSPALQFLNINELGKKQQQHTDTLQNTSKIISAFARKTVSLDS